MKKEAQNLAEGDVVEYYDVATGIIGECECELAYHFWDDLTVENTWIGKYGYVFVSIAASKWSLVAGFDPDYLIGVRNG